MCKKDKINDSLVFKVTSADKEKFKKICGNKQVNSSEILRAYVNACVNANSVLFIL